MARLSQTLGPALLVFGGRLEDLVVAGDASRIANVCAEIEVVPVATQSMGG
jgi:hypothetical protein